MFSMDFVWTMDFNFSREFLIVYTVDFVDFDI